MSLSQELKELGFKVELECLAQINKWGEQDHPNFRCDPTPEDPEARYDAHGIMPEHIAKQMCNQGFSEGNPTYGAIFAEEVSEVFGSKNDKELEGELIQCAAVAINWIRAIRRRRIAALYETTKGVQT